jgi:hypothetical protein
MKKRINAIGGYIFFSEITRRGRRRGSIKKYWEIEVNKWALNTNVLSYQPESLVAPQNLDVVRDICDPLRNKSGKNGIKWKFRSLTTAEQCYTFLALKFS